MTWEEEEDLFESTRFTQRDIIKIYLEVTSFKRQFDEVPNWLNVYKKTTYYPSWHNDFRKFHNQIRPEVLDILEKESKFFRSLRFNLEFVMKSKKHTRRGEPILVKVFDRQIELKMLDILLAEQLEELAKQSEIRLNKFQLKDRVFFMPHKCPLGDFTVEIRVNERTELHNTSL